LIPTTATSRTELIDVPEWLPPGKRAALCFSIDDVHPAKSSDPYEAGGDCRAGALGKVEWLLERHPKLQVTLFVTADWREISPHPTRRILASLPLISDHVYLAPRWPAGRMRLDRHPQFVDYLRGLPRTEIALHGLHHCHKGPRIPVEFQDESCGEISRKLSAIFDIFRAAGVEFAAGMCPPGWNAPEALLSAMVAHGLKFIASARDVVSEISSGGLTAMSGLRGASLVRPQLICSGALVHVTSNFSATTPVERARDIIACHGLIAIKAHIVKNAMGLISLDGVDDVYMNYLDLLLTRLEDEYGEELWWTSMSEVADRLLSLSDGSFGAAC
jgi:hypothetical protein